MKYESIKLFDLISLIVYSYSDGQDSIDKYTLERIIFIFYQIKDFIDAELLSNENQISTISNGVLSVVGFEEVFSSMIRGEAKIVINSGGALSLSNDFKELIEKLLEQDGDFADKAKIIMPFLNVIRKYTPQLVFGIFLSEPDFVEAVQRNTDTIPSKDSQLSKLLNKFRNKIDDSDISDYDIISTWMEFAITSFNKG